MKLKPEKKQSGLNGIRIHDLYNAGAVFTEATEYQANWELVSLRVRNSPVEYLYFNFQLRNNVMKLLQKLRRFKDCLDNRKKKTRVEKIVLQCIRRRTDTT